MKTMNRLTSILLALAMILALMPLTALPAKAEGPSDNWDHYRDVSWGTDYDSTDVFTVNTAGDLAQFAFLVNNGKNFDGKTVSLAANVDLSAHYWTPIGTYSNSNIYFCGTFDGQCHSIHGLNVSGNHDYAGLFGYVYNGSVKDMLVTGSIVSAGSSVTGAGAAAGGIAANLEAVNGSAAIINCSFRGSVSAEVENVRLFEVGGIVGRISCGNGGDNASVQLSCCSHSGGSVSARSGEAFAGGIAGFVHEWDSSGSSDDVFTMSDCYHVGAVTASAQGSHAVGGVDASAGSIVGRLVRLHGGADSNSEVSNCYHGGGSITATGGSTRYAGGIVGSNHSLGSDYDGAPILIPVTGCYYPKDGTPNKGIGSEDADAEGRTKGLTAAQFKNTSSFSGWNFTDVWYMGAEAPMLRAFNTPVSSWSDLQTALTSGKELVVLTGDVTAGSSDGVLTVPSGRTVTLDLAGHVLDRGKSNAASTNDECNVINVEGSLTFTDSAPNATHEGKSYTDPISGSSVQLPNGGVVTGGNGVNHGGGVYIDGSGTFVLNGGSICGNRGYSGGGVYMYSGTFNMNGGRIRGNSATSQYGGGVYVFGSSGTFSMNGGVITGNSAAEQGGGVYVSRSGFTFNVSGSPRITGNTKGSAANNVFVSGSDTAMITVGTLTTGASIGVSMLNGYNAVTFTEGAGFTNAAAAQTYFFADNSSGYTITADNGQAVLSPKPATAPAINTQPASPEAPLPYGYTSSGITLSITASAATGADYTLSYQWYKGNNENFELGDSTKINSGGNNASYTVPTGLTAGTHYYKCVIIAKRNDNDQSAGATSRAAVVQVGYSVGITAGEGMTLNSGTATQTVVRGAMTDVYYTANNGYYFPENYSSAGANGISVSRIDLTQIKVSGTPTANVALSLSAATAKEKETTPTGLGKADCTTTANNDGKLTGVTTAMEYKKSDETSWTNGTGSDITGLVPGTYYVRVKATDTTLASDNQELTIAGYTAPTYEVTYKVVGGTWSDDSTGKKTENVQSGSKPASVPTGMKASEGYTGGAWNKNPAEATITEATEFTYTFTAKQAAIVTKDPTANDPTYSGNSQELVTAGVAENGTMNYAIGTNETTAPTTGWSASIPDATDAGTFYVWYKAAGDSSHSDSEAAFVTAKIKKRSVTLTSEGGDKTYDGSALTKPEVTVSGDGFVEGEVSDIKATGSVTTVAEGEVTNTITYTESATFKDDNYTITKIEGKLKITQKAVTATVTAVNRDYEAGNTSVSLTAGTVNDVVSGDDVTVDVSAASGTMADDGAGENKAVTVTGVKLGGKAAGNYTLSAQPTDVTVTINKANAVAATVTANNRKYDGTEEMLVTVDDSTLVGTMLYALGTATEAPDSYTATIPTATAAGTYYVWYKVKGDDNHNDTESTGPITVTISRPYSGGVSSAIIIQLKDGVNGKTIINITGTISGSTINLNTISKDIFNKAARTDGSAIIDASGLKKNIKEIRFNAATVKNLKNSDVKSLEIILTDGSIILDKKAIETVEAASSGTGSLKVHIEKVNVSTLTKARQEALKGVDSPIIFDVTITRGNVEIHDLDGGKVTMKVRYECSEGKVPDLFYLTEAGVLERVPNVEYKDGFLIWTEDHCSVYVVKEISTESGTVNKMIDALGENPYAYEVEAARAAYEALGDKKSEVDESVVRALEEAELKVAKDQAEAAIRAAEKYKDDADVRLAIDALQKAVESKKTEDIKAVTDALNAAVEAAAAAQKAAEDKKAADAKTLADAITAANTALQAAQPYTSNAIVNTAINALKKALAGNDAAAIKAATTALNNAVTAAKNKKTTPATLKTASVKLKKARYTIKRGKNARIKVKKKTNGKVTFKKTKGNKNIIVSKAGKIKVKKGAKKGKTYTIKVKIRSAKTSTYKAFKATRRIRIKVR